MHILLHSSVQVADISVSLNNMLPQYLYAHTITKQCTSGRYQHVFKQYAPTVPLYTYYYNLVYKWQILACLQLDMLPQNLYAHTITQQCTSGRYWHVFKQVCSNSNSLHILLHSSVHVADISMSSIIYAPTVPLCTYCYKVVYKWQILACLQIVIFPQYLYAHTVAQQCASGRYYNMLPEYLSSHTVAKQCAGTFIVPLTTVPLTVLLPQISSAQVACIGVFPTTCCLRRVPSK